MAKEFLTANANIMKPDNSGFWLKGETFDADELTDKGAYLKAAGHVSSSLGEPVKAEPKNDALESENRGLKIKVGKLEAFAKKVNAHVAKLPADQKKAFEEAMKADPEPPKPE